jgi:hypothetical protein
MHDDRDAGQLVTIVTTEHFTLQTARASTISEANGRASIYLGASSSALIALAFIGQTAGLRTVFTFGMYILLPLVFVGVVTFKRALQSGIEDALYARRINELRRFYFHWEGVLDDYLLQPVPSDDVAEVMEQAGYVARGWWQPFLTVSGMIGVINSFLIGVLAGFITRIAGGELILATWMSGALFVLSLIAHLRHQMQAWQRIRRR